MPRHQRFLSLGLFAICIVGAGCGGYTSNTTSTSNQAPVFSSASATTFTAGTAGSFTVVTTGYPAPTVTESGALPSGVTFNAATGVLGGTATAGASFPVTFTAQNGVGAAATQSFTLTVNQSPGLRALTTTFTVGTAYPSP